MQASSAAEYDVFTNEFKTFNMGQAGSIIPYKEKVYFGVYPGAKLYEYEPLKESSSTNPHYLFTAGQRQDRLMYGVVGGGKIYIPSIPDYGELGGAIVVFDPRVPDPENSYQTFRNIVQDQSVISVTYFKGKLYGATSIRGGLGSSPIATEAKMFVWDVEKQEKITEFTLDIPGLVHPEAIAGLTIGPDNLIWGGLSNTVFAIDPETLKVVKHQDVFPNDNNWEYWASAEMQWNKGLLYMCLGCRLVVLNPVTIEFEHLADADAFAVGEDGNIYYSPHSKDPETNRTQMFRIETSITKR